MKTREEKPKSYGKMIFILLSLLFISICISFFLGTGTDTDIIDYNTALIKISGPIYTSGEGGFFEDITTSEEIVKEIEKISNDKQIKAVILEINSPGGAPVATDEISQAVEELKKDNITCVAWIREVGASGAYWIASSSNYIVSNRMSIVGSIGVYGSYIEWYGLMDSYNVTYKRLVSGKYKDSGTPFRPMSEDEEKIIQSKLDRLHEYFIESVASNRQMPKDKVRQLATGEIFLGVEAKDNGLVDEMGGKKEVMIYISNKIGEEVKIREFTKQKSLLESLMSAMNRNSYYVGKGIGKSIFNEGNFEIKI